MAILTARTGTCFKSSIDTPLKSSTFKSRPECPPLLQLKTSSSCNQILEWTQIPPSISKLRPQISEWAKCLTMAKASVSRRWLQKQGKGVMEVLSLFLVANLVFCDIAASDAYDTFENVPQDISGGEERKRIQRPKSKKAENCTSKCVGTCIRGGAGAPGEGPLNVRHPLVVFKEGFRTRKYCLIECSDICNLIGDGDDGP